MIVKWFNSVKEILKDVHLMSLVDQKYIFQFEIHQIISTSKTVLFQFSNAKK